MMTDPISETSVPNAPIGPESSNSDINKSSRLAQLSVVRKMALLGALVVTIGITVMVAFGVYGQRSILIDEGEKSFLAVTQILAKNITGGMRWGKPGAVERSYKDFADRDGSAVSSILTLTQTGETLTSYGSSNLKAFDLQSFLGKNSSLTSQKNAVLARADGQVVIAVPVGLDDKGNRFGTLIVAWSLQDLENKVLSALWRELLIGALCLAGIILALLVAGNKFIGQPLGLITHAMEKLSAGDVNAKVPATERVDEIGEMARAVIVFQNNAIKNAELEQSAKDEQVKFEAERKAQEKIIETSIGEVVASANSGNLSTRIDTSDLSGVLERVSDGVNTLLDNVDRGVSESATMMSALASGDMTERMAGDHQGRFLQLKNDANRMGEQVTSIAERIVVASDAVQGATREISSGVTDLSTRTEHQASSLEETTASMEELSATVRQNADNAQEANQVAMAAQESASNGGEVVGEVVSAMSRIEGSSKKITDIVGLIQEIAFQTNLLALNAAVEAARAGDAGKGFAVVASEVRALAQRSGQASKDIKELIVNSDNEVREGVDLVTKAGESLSEIVTSVKKVADFVSEIAAASQEQSAGIDQVSRAINSMEEMTQQNGALVEETTAALQSAQGQIDGLREVVSFFKVGDGTFHPTAATPASETKMTEKSAKTDIIDNPVRKQQSIVRQAVSGGGVAARDMIEQDSDWQQF